MPRCPEEYIQFPFPWRSTSYWPANPLQDNWSPALQIRTILLSIQALLGAPNPDDPLANDVAQRWKEDEPAAIETAKEWTGRYAMV